MSEPVQPQIVSILSIDPGTTEMGWAYTQYDKILDELYVQDCGVIHPTKLVKRMKEDRSIFEERILKVNIVVREYRKLVTKYRANYHVSEDAFFNHRSPIAYALLSICIHSMATVLYDCYKEELLDERSAILNKIPPRQIKKLSSEYGGSDKAEMQVAVLSNPKIKFAPHVDTATLVSHSVDAIAGSFAFSRIMFMLN